MTTTTIDTVAGPMVIDADELQIGRFLDAEGNIPTHDEAIAFMKRHVKAGDSCIDVGANAGFFTLVLADIVGPEGHVTAFEPNYAMIKCLGQTLVDRDLLPYVDAIMMAVGREKGWGKLRMDPRGPGGTQVTLEEPGAVMVGTLDTAPYIRRPVSFIKIDTEGMDVDVLLGAGTILEEDRPAILFEWNPEAMIALGKDPEQEFSSLWDIIELNNYFLCDYRTDAAITWNIRPTSMDYAMLPGEKVDG